MKTYPYYNFIFHLIASGIQTIEMSSNFYRILKWHLAFFWNQNGKLQNPHKKLVSLEHKNKWIL